MTWAVLAVALGPALDATLADRSRAISLLLTVVLWGVWTVGLVAVLVPRTIGLTFLRITAPAGLVLAVWSAASEADTWAAVLAVLAASVTTMVALSPTTGDAFVNGSAYGPERRFALRVPASLLFGPLQLTWFIVVAGALAGPLLLAAERWVAGAIATTVGLPLAALASRSLHQLSRRWLVFVPAGVVVHDPTAVASQLLQRSTVRQIGPAPADTTAHDLTGGALGLALLIDLAEPVTVEPRRRRGATVRPVETDQLLVTPTRPGAVLREATARRLPVG